MPSITWKRETITTGVQQIPNSRIPTFRGQLLDLKELRLHTFYYDKMKKLSVQLAYKLGGFTDKDNIKILTDSVSPGSTSGSNSYQMRTTKYCSGHQPCGEFPVLGCVD